MKPKTFALLVVAAGCGLVAMLGVQQAMQGSQPSAQRATVKVFVAIDNIETGMRLSSDNVTLKEVPIDSVPEDAVRTEEEYAQRAARIPILGGDVISMSRLTEKGAFGRSIEIPVGMRVITIPVDDTHTNSGLMQAGDRVDVLVTYQSKSERGQPISKTKTLLEYVQVFATDNHTASKMEEGKESVRAKNVALLLWPDQANFVVLAQQKGRISLVWRNRSDDELVQTKSLDDGLLEELEGTVGLHDSYQPIYDSPYVDGESGSNLPYANESSLTATEFLDTVEEPPAEITEPPETPVWKVRVYHGNAPVEHAFEIEDKLEKQVESALNSSSGSLTEIVKSFWNKKAPREQSLLPESLLKSMN